jgi:XTP/dITP diphosphohydrolase
MRKLGSERLVIATHNAGKLKEIAALLTPYGLECVSAGSLGLLEPAETGKTFAENALIKARAAAEASQLPALADDSGLSVTALNGRPGVYTADWAERQWLRAKEAATGIWPWARSKGSFARKGPKLIARHGFPVCSH